MTLTAPIAVVVLLAGAVLGIPVVIGGNGSSSAAGCGELAFILDTIRTIESGGDYTVPTNRGGASGAYQYIDNTWNEYRGYRSAYLAPPEIQEARAASDVQTILATYGDIAFIPVVWYWPAAATDPTQLDIVPMPGAGNRLTVRAYQQHWLATFETKTATGTLGDCTGAIPTEDGYALPIDRTLVAANPSMLDQPHHDYPAIDLLVPEGSPVFAVRGGVVARVVNWPYNCYEIESCDQTCGVGLSIDGDDGARYIYCHATQLNSLSVGDNVIAGQLLMWSGNTGRSGTPHLHFEISVNGKQRCPQALLRGIYETARAPDPEALSASGCTS
ncbi:MAG: M23 family metallopeptidase [Candidatus Limnocylindrales bacterium]